MRWLFERELIDHQQSERADLAWTAARNELLVLRSALAQTERALADARLGPEHVRSKEDEIAALEQSRAALVHAVRARDQAEAAVAEAESVRSDLTIVAPIAGVVMTRMVDLGEVVAAGAPLLDLVDLDRLYLKVFVPEAQIGKLRLGLAARVHTDAFPMGRLPPPSATSPRRRNSHPKKSRPGTSA